MKMPMILAALALGGFMSCNQNTPKTEHNTESNQNQANMPSPTSKVGKMEDQVMALHEKTMQDLDSVMGLKKELKSVAAKNGLSKADNDSIDANLHRLQKSDDDMMDWMNNYNEPDKMMAEDKAVSYLNIQLNKIEGIYAEMQRSMIEADKFLKANK